MKRAVLDLEVALALLVVAAALVAVVWLVYAGWVS